MSRITGKNGQVKVGSDVIANLTDWSLDLKLPTADTTAMGDQFETKASLIRGWTGQVKGTYGNAAEAIDFMNSFFNATTDGGAQSGKITVSLYTDAATAEKWVGDCFAEFSLSVDKSKPNEFTAKITGTGALVYTANS